MQLVIVRYNSSTHMISNRYPPLVNKTPGKIVKSLPYNFIYSTVYHIYECCICGYDLFKLFPEYFKTKDISSLTNSKYIGRCARCSRPFCKHYIYDVDGKSIYIIEGFDKYLCAICLCPYKSLSYKKIKTDRWFGTKIHPKYQLILSICL